MQRYGIKDLGMFIGRACCLCREIAWQMTCQVWRRNFHSAKLVFLASKPDFLSKEEAGEHVKSCN